MALKGIHHITLVAARAQRTVHFYVDVLGLHFVKRTVNFDRSDTYHLYFGDRTGTPGTLVTFFEWPDAPPAQLGVGTTHHFALSVDSYEALLKWKTWLQHAHCLVAGPFDHQAYRSIVFTDPDGVVLEIATSEPGWQTMTAEGEFVPLHDRLATETWPEPVPSITPDMAFRSLHHISAICSDMERTNAFYEEILSIPSLYRTTEPDIPATPRWFWSTGSGDAAGRPGTVITYTQDSNGGRGQVGHGMTHHFALEVADEEALEHWREWLLEREIDVTEIRDRKYFRSIYFDDPDGQLLEIATSGPGFLVDQQLDRLGKDLALPDWLEPERSRIEAALPRIG